MSRKLGGGRILGSGRSLSPALGLPPRSSSLISPSESSISLSSETSASQLSGEGYSNDLSSKVSLDNGIPLSSETTTTQLVCPICNEDMLTLLQLNRHLDDNHQNLEAVEQDEVKTWFKKQMVKAKKFQPLAVLNQKLKGLDVFEANEAQASLSQAPSIAASAEPSAADPDDLVSKSHWQRPTPGDRCLEPTCGKALGARNGSVNCRKCGRLFCNEHTMYQMKLSRSAQHEPVRGFWCRVCETCYKSREGYGDHTGSTRDHSQDFLATRRKAVDARFLEITRLEKRLTKLTQLLSSQLLDQGGGGGGGSGTGLLRWPLGASRNQRKALEQSVVAWEDDAGVSMCPFCHQEFSAYTNRRHHCRLCGRVVCGDASTGCSSEVSLDVASPTDVVSEKPPSGDLHIQVRMCKDCSHTLFSRRDRAEELARKPADLRSYESLVQFERGIRALLPRFQSLLVFLQDPETPPSSSQLAEASKIRRRLMDSFAQYDVAARRIRDLPSDSSAQRRLQKAVHQQATSFLHLYMLPLKTLPRVLRGVSSAAMSSSSLSSSSSSSSATLMNGINGRHQHRRRDGNGNGNDKNQKASSSLLISSETSGLDGANNSSTASTASATSTLISAMEAEERQLRERLIVLEEQRFFVDDMLATARRRRKFDDLTALTHNLADLKHEINVVNDTLGRLDFAAVYEGGVVTGGAASGSVPGPVPVPGLGSGSGSAPVSSAHLPSLKVNGEDPSGLVLS